MKIFGFSVVTIAVVILAYYIGTKFPGPVRAIGL